VDVGAFELAQGDAGAGRSAPRRPVPALTAHDSTAADRPPAICWSDGLKRPVRWDPAARRLRGGGGSPPGRHARPSPSSVPTAAVRLRAKTGSFDSGSRPQPSSSTPQGPGDADSRSRLCAPRNQLSSARRRRAFEDRSPTLWPTYTDSPRPRDARAAVTVLRCSPGHRQLPARGASSCRSVEPATVR